MLKANGRRRLLGGVDLGDSGSTIVGPKYNLAVCCGIILEVCSGSMIVGEILGSGRGATIESEYVSK